MKLTREERDKVLEWKELGYYYVRFTIGGVMLSTAHDELIEHNGMFSFSQDISNHYYKDKVQIQELLLIGVGEPKDESKESPVDRLDRIKWKTPYNHYLVKSASTGATTQEHVEYVVPKDDWEFLLRQAQRLQDLSQTINSISNKAYSVPKYGGISTEVETFE